jgi:hypothetical protein
LTPWLDCVQLAAGIAGTLAYLVREGEEEATELALGFAFVVEDATALDASATAAGQEHGEWSLLCWVPAILASPVSVADDGEPGLAMHQRRISSMAMRSALSLTKRRSCVVRNSTSGTGQPFSASVTSMRQASPVVAIGNKDRQMAMRRSFICVLIRQRWPNATTTGGVCEV